MSNRIALSALFALGFIGPALAGPCSERIADVERSIGAATTEGSPKPAVTDSSSGTPVNVTAESKNMSEGMNMLNQAKDLDKQGKEKECMDIVAKVATTKAPHQNK
jgi:hypothetical protein